MSNTAKLTPNNSAFAGGVTGKISVTGDSITSVAHGLTTGLGVIYSTAANANTLGGLSFGTTYYAIRIDADQFKLASSAANATAGTAVDISSITEGGTYRFLAQPWAVATQNGFKWQGSNDGLSFGDLTSSSISSVTFSAAGTTLFTFPDYAYKYLRMSFTPGATGGLNINAVINGRR